MPFATATIIAAIGAAAAVGGGIEQTIASNEAHAAQQKEEDARNLQMNLDAARQRRDIARRAILARSTALTNATTSGAEFGSGLQGGEAQVAGQAGQATQAVNQNQQIGQQIFDANAQQSSAATSAAFGGAIASAGSSIFSNRDMLGRVGSYITGKQTWGNPFGP